MPEEPVVPIGDVLAAQQDTIEELTTAVARHERVISVLMEALTQAGIDLPDLDRGE